MMQWWLQVAVGDKCCISSCCRCRHFASEVSYDWWHFLSFWRWYC